MHQIQLETDELRLVIRSLEQHAAANGDELADCEYLIRTLQCELDREARLERAVEALQELVAGHLRRIVDRYRSSEQKTTCND